MVYVRMKPRTKAHGTGQWSQAKRIEAVTLYLTVGSLPEVSRIMGIPYKTLEQWKQSPWWEDLVKKIHLDEDQKMDLKTSKIVDKALDALLDRIENGEYIYDQKTGKIKQTPAKLADLTKAFNTVLDKRQLLRKQPTKIVEQTTTATQLQNLADQFAKFVQKTTAPEIPFIDGQTVVENADGTYTLKE
jgi:hypothetical protein